MGAGERPTCHRTRRSCPCPGPAAAASPGNRRMPSCVHLGYGAFAQHMRKGSIGGERLPRPGHRRAGLVAGRAGRSGKQPRSSGFSGCRRLPVWLLVAGHLCGTHPEPQLCLVSARPPAHPQGYTSVESDCLRAVRHPSDNNFEYDYSAALSAPRPRLERGTCCLGGTFETWPRSARRGLTCDPAAARMAGHGLA